MMFGFVTIVGRDGAAIFIDGSVETAGNAPGPFVVQYGSHKFETRNAAGKTTASATATVDSETVDVTLTARRGS